MQRFEFAGLFRAVRERFYGFPPDFPDGSHLRLNAPDERGAQMVRDRLCRRLRPPPFSPDSVMRNNADAPNGIARCPILPETPTRMDHSSGARSRHGFHNEAERAPAPTTAKWRPHTGPKTACSAPGITLHWHRGRSMNSSWLLNGVITGNREIPASGKGRQPQLQSGVRKLKEPTGNELLEIYRLHAELADRVSQRREGANRLYVSLLVGLALFLGVFIRFGVGDFPMDILFQVTGTIGAILSISWYIVIRSYRQLNAGKFAALHELEAKLAYPFFKREWELLDKGKNLSRYWRLTIVETGLPITFLILSVALFAVSFH